MTPARPILLAALCATLALASCVTERTDTGRGVRVKPGTGAGGPAGVGSAAGPAAPSLDGPVARPARGVTTNAAVGVTFVPLGAIAYDGQALPVVSPDGRFLAVQQGEAPAWNAILAEDGATVPAGTTIVVYDISGNAARRLESPALPPGVLLGRGADREGFLIESPRENGARWIGRANWVTGEPTWLAHDDRVSAHAVLAPDGALLFTRRDVGASRAVLVRRAPSGQERETAPADGTYVAPLAGNDPRTVFALRRVAQGLAIDVLRARGDEFERTPVSRLLHTSDDPTLAHQVALSVPSASTPAPGAAGADGALVILNPSRARMSLWDGASGSLETLAPGTIAAARSPDPNSPGYFCTTRDGLVFVSKVGTAGPTGAPVVVIDTPYVPRTVWSAPPQLVLFGPSKDSPDQIEIVRMLLTAPAPQ
ncbi:MAG: hypothetical protein SFY69_05215 [Planctomycetota bacterium]|nr:hypothetical protein [Planctomycetota bacterium]